MLHQLSSFPSGAVHLVELDIPMWFGFLLSSERNSHFLKSALHFLENVAEHLPRSYDSFLAKQTTLLARNLCELICGDDKTHLQPTVSVLSMLTKRDKEREFIRLDSDILFSLLPHFKSLKKKDIGEKEQKKVKKKPKIDKEASDETTVLQQISIIFSNFKPSLPMQEKDFHVLRWCTTSVHTLHFILVSSQENNSDEKASLAKQAQGLLFKFLLLLSHVFRHSKEDRVRLLNSRNFTETLILLYRSHSLYPNPLKTLYLLNYVSSILLANLRRERISHTQTLDFYSQICKSVSDKENLTLKHIMEEVLPEMLSFLTTEDISKRNTFSPLEKWINEALSIFYRSLFVGMQDQKPFLLFLSLGCKSSIEAIRNISGKL